MTLSRQLNVVSLCLNAAKLFNILGLTKLLVGLGQSEANKYLNGFEILDLENPNAKCRTIAPYPLDISGAAADLGLEGQPIICGGKNDAGIKQQCFTLGSGWEPKPGMISPLVDAQIASWPQPGNAFHLVLTGGYNGERVNQMAVLTSKEWMLLPASLPEAVSAHCMVMMNSTSLIVIGGWTNSLKKTKDTFIFHSWNHKWTKGSPLNLGRSSHSCARIRCCHMFTFN